MVYKDKNISFMVGVRPGTVCLELFSTGVVFKRQNLTSIDETSESDVHRRQILTPKDGPCPERIENL